MKNTEHNHHVASKSCYMTSHSTEATKWCSALDGHVCLLLGEEKVPSIVGALLLEFCQ